MVQARGVEGLRVLVGLKALPDKPFFATPGAIEKFSHETIIACLRVLQQKAEEHNGIDYLQVFESADGDRLWFIEDGEGGAITALLPEEY